MEDQSQEKAFCEAESLKQNELPQVKTYADVNKKAYDYAEKNWSEEYRKPSAHSYTAGYVAAQSRITDLESENDRLREALKEISETGVTSGNHSRCIEEIYKIASEALNPNRKEEK